MCEEFPETLDHLYERLRAGDDVDDALDDLYRHLSCWRARADEPAWRRVIVERIRPHRLCELLHRDPFTRRAFQKPRGYAGDAVLIDYLYGLAPHTALDPLGHRVHRHVISTRSARSVAHRRTGAAAWIDATPAGGRVLAVAAGHLREAELSRRLAAADLGGFIALDQDEASLAVVREQYGSLGVRTIHASVRQVVNGSLTARNLDLVYTTGLYDYLSRAAAQRLTRTLWDMLAPGGRLVIANFTPDTADFAYIEAFMDWWLIGRTRQQMRDLFAGLPPETIGDLRVEAPAGTDLLYATARHT